MPENKTIETGTREFDVTVSRTGTARVSAVSAAEAMEKADKLPADAIAWDDGFIPTDAEEHDPFGTEG